MTQRHSNPGAEPNAIASFEENDAQRVPLFTFIQAVLTALAVILLLASLSAHGESYNFHSYGKPEGLENLDLYSLLQDQSGQLWMGTQNGLYRFDGAHITRVKSFEGNEVPQITAISEDSAARLWITSFHQVRYRDAAGMQDPHLPYFGAEKSTTTALASFPEDRDQVFLLADQTLYRIVTRDGGATWQEQRVLKPEVVREHPELTSLESLAAVGGQHGEPGSRTLWMACGKKLCEISPDNGTVQVWGAHDGIPEDDWKLVVRDHAGNLWVRSTQHLARLPRGSAHFIPVEEGLTPKLLDLRQPSMAEDPQGRMLINLNDGIARREGENWHVFGTVNGLPPHIASHLLFDRQGSFWFSVDGHGVRRWLGYDNWQSWSARDGLTVGSVWAMDEDARGAMWVPGELGVQGLSSPLGTWRPLDPSRSLRQAQGVLVDRRGHIWVALATGLLMDYDPVTHLGRQVAKTEGLSALLEDKRGTIWVGGTKALFHLDEATHYSRLDGDWQGKPLALGGISEIKTAPDGLLYFGGEKGLFVLNPADSQGAQPVKLPAGIRLPTISPMAVAPDGTLWIEGDASPLIHLRIHGTTAELIERVGVPTVSSLAVWQLSIDHRGWLWVGTDRGMDVYDGKRWVGLSTEDGLIYDDLDSDSFHEARDGSIWMGTTGGLSRLMRPEEIFRQEPLMLNLDGARMGAMMIQLKGNTKVAWKNRGALTLDLGISNPSRANVVSYRYRMEGLESDWQETDERQIHFSGLPPGKYRLAVIAVDGRRHQQSAPVYIEFRLMPPWWRTGWFLSGVAILLACLAGLVSWWRVSALIAQQQHLEDLVKERTHQLELEKKELIEARLALVEQASRDGLTGLLNRSAIFDVLTAEIIYATEKETPLAIVLADLDHFKRINDTYGHQIGDAVLRECARRFGLATRPTDYIGRYGGEELLLVMPGLSQENSMERLENLRATIAHEMFDCEGIGLPVTCSFGVAWVDDQIRTLKPLIALADQALYTAKTRGRNRVETIATASTGLFFPDGSGPLLTLEQ